MTETAVGQETGGTPPARLTTRQLAFDVLLALVLLAVVLPINLSGIEAVPANRPPGPMLVVLTVLAIVPIALRRLYPLTVLSITLLAGLALVLTRNTVGFATLGPLVASYTAVAYSSRSRARIATGILLTALVLAAILRPVDLSVEGAVVQLVVFVGGWLLARGTRERRELFAAGLGRARDEAARERDRADAERERAARTASEERLRISRELHDVVGHALSVVVVQAGVAEQLLDSRPDEARGAVAEIARTGRQALAEIRELLGVLRETDDDSDPLNRPLSPTLADLGPLVDGVRGAGLAVELQISGEARPLPVGIELAAYRVIQEALTNSLKHANATRARVGVIYTEGLVEVEITDDGQRSGPFADVADTASAGHASGHGLAGMRERVAVYGGEFTAGPDPAGGFGVRARFPLPRSGASTVPAALSGNRAP